MSTETLLTTREEVAAALAALLDRSPDWRPDRSWGECGVLISDLHARGFAWSLYAGGGIGSTCSVIRHKPGAEGVPGFDQPYLTFKHAFDHDPKLAIALAALAALTMEAQQ